LEPYTQCPDNGHSLPTRLPPAPLRDWKTVEQKPKIDVVMINYVYKRVKGWMQEHESKYAALGPMKTFKPLVLRDLSNVGDEQEAEVIKKLRAIFSREDLAIEISRFC
jgi:hypothetical protein